MAFMIPQYWQATAEHPMYEIENRYESYLTSCVDYLEPDETIAQTYTTGWFCQLSAPGYSDCTDISGPFDTLAEAKEHIANQWEVDAETGEDLAEQA